MFQIFEREEITGLVKWLHHVFLQKEDRSSELEVCNKSMTISKRGWRPELARQKGQVFCINDIYSGLDKQLMPQSSSPGSGNNPAVFLIL